MMLPVLLVVGIVFLGLGYWAFVLWRKQAGPRPPKQKPETAEERVRRLDREAQQQVAAGNLEAGRKLFLQAGRHGKAAQVAVREGNLELAGQLFEKARLYEKAMVAFQKAGNAAKAAELRALLEQRGLPRTVSVSCELPVVQQGASAAPAPKPAEEANSPDEKRSSGVQLISVPPSNDVVARAPGPVDEPPLELPRVSKGSTAWLLEEDELLDLPRADEPATSEPAAGTASGKAALGALSLVKAKKAVGVVEETSSVKRSRKDER
jgi:hypothetical protein